MTQFHDNKYLEMVQYILDNGIWKENRTGVRTKSVFGYQMRFDLSDGTIPLLTTKKMHLRSIIHELLWYFKGTSSEYELAKTGTTIWKEWATPLGELGPVYGEMWRNWPTREVTYVTPRIVSLPLNKKPHIEPTLIEVIPSDDPFVNTTHNTKECGMIKVINVNISTDNKKTYDIQFLNTGSIKNQVSKNIIKRGHIIDVYLPRVYGIGYLGEFDKKDPYLKQLQRHWYKILERCYDPSVTEYQLYGGAGIFVHPDWHNFATFQSEVRQIPGWNLKRRYTNYQLDKDFYGSNCYSKHTCCWLSPADNTLYRNNPNPFKYTLQTGMSHIDISVTYVADKLGLKQSGIYRALKHNKSYKGIKFEWLNTSNGCLARINRFKDQIAELVHNLKNDPNSRRLIVSAWHPELLPDATISPEINAENGLQALPPCHYTFQCYVNDGKLSMILNQRSADVGLGVPFNIVQYSLLLRMLAEVSGLLPGEFIWNGGDVHIYENHIEPLQEQLTRDPYESPTFEFARQITDIDDFKFEDFVIKDYESYPTIKMDVAK